MKTRSRSEYYSDGSNTMLNNPYFRIITTWLFLFIVLASAVVIFFILRINFNELRLSFIQYPHVWIIIELVAVGLLPIIFTMVCKDNLIQYGITKKNIGISLLLSSLVVIFSYTFQFFLTGHILPILPSSIQLNFPLNLFYAILGIFAYGPLEVFFVIWLVVNTEKIIKSGSSIVSWGLIVTVIIFGVLHIITTGSVINAILITILFFIFGLIFKYTGNSFGSMVAWLLINTQAWLLARQLWY